MQTAKIQITEPLTLDRFKRQFKFNPVHAGKIGIEREFFLTTVSGDIQPIAPLVINSLLTDAILPSEYGYELSACQLECRTPPSHINSVYDQLCGIEQRLQQKETQFGFGRSCVEVAPANLPLDVYPDPTGRYQRLIKTMPRHILSAACRVIGTHIHVGMPNHEVALRAYNYASDYCDELCGIGDHSNGERLRLYAVVAPRHRPEKYQDWQAFYEHALDIGFANEPRNCWHLIRLTRHGSIEFRMFGTTADLREIVGWAHRCLEICQRAA